MNGRLNAILTDMPMIILLRVVVVELTRRSYHIFAKKFTSEIFLRNALPPL